MYIRRKLLPNERNYYTVEKEALAIKWSLDKLRYYLLGREFTLVTDHAPLKWMAGAKDTNARVTRWFLALQDFRFQVAHRPGKEHANADALSRRDACLGWNPSGRWLGLAVEECGNPPPSRGRVVEGVYRRHPRARHGERSPADRDGRHEERGKHRGYKAERRTDSKEATPRRRSTRRITPQRLRGSRRP